MLFTAYAIVRTVPSANRPNRRKKKRWWHLPCSSRYRRPAVLHAAWQSLHPLGTPAAQNVPPQTDLGTKSPRGMGTHPVRKQGSSLQRCKPADRPSSKKMAKCLLPLSFTGHLRTPRHQWTTLQLSLEKWPRFCSKSKVIHLLRKWSSQQEVVTHLPQTAQSVAPAAMNTPAPVRPCSSSNLKRLTWGTHGCHTRRVTTVQHRCCRGTHGWLVLSRPGTPPLP